MLMLTAVLLLATPEIAPEAAKPVEPMAPVVAQHGRDRVWLELDAGPLALHHSGIRGLESGPEVRLSVGVPIGDRFAAELWALGALQSGRAVVGDEAAAGGGLGARLKLHDFTGDGRLQLFGRAGAGLVAPTTPDAPHGLSGFAGALLLLQPPVRRFALGLELDATVVGRAYGMALLPTLRCAL